MSTYILAQKLVYIDHKIFTCSETFDHLRSIHPISIVKIASSKKALSQHRIWCTNDLKFIVVLTQ